MVASRLASSTHMDAYREEERAENDLLYNLARREMVAVTDRGNKWRRDKEKEECEYMETRPCNIGCY